MFKENRWWWNVGVQTFQHLAKASKEPGKDQGTSISQPDPEYDEGEEADEDELQARANEKSPATEDFRE